MHIHHRSPDIRARAHELRDRKLAGGLAWQGSTFQVDADSRLAIATRALRAQRTVEEVVWRTLDNQEIAFSADEFVAFADAVDAFYEQAVRDCWALKQAT